MVLGSNNTLGRCRLWFYTLIGCVCFTSFAACEKAARESPSSESRTSLLPETLQARAAISPTALAYLEAALDTIQALHPIGPSHDWEEWRLVVLERARGAEELSDTYEAIRFALTDLPGGHASFAEPSPTVSTYANDAPLQPANDASSISSVHAKLMRGHIGTVILPSFLPTDPKSAGAFASQVQQQIRLIDSENPCGWIVDLRRNGGGNMWPMILGIGPVLGEGKVGAVATRDGITEAWYHQKGEARLDSMVLASVTAPYEVRKPGLPTAVLIGRNTGSSGEAIAVAFHGRPRSRFFGEPTAGATSSPVFIRLEDGAVMGFAGSFMADRNGATYAGPIQPDVSVPGEPWDDPDQAQQEAIRWLEEQSECQLTR